MPAIEGRVFRKEVEELHLQFGLTPRHSPGSQLPANADVVSRLLMIRMEKIEEHFVDEERVTMKKCMALVAQEILELWDRALPPTRAYPWAHTRAGAHGPVSPYRFGGPLRRGGGALRRLKTASWLPQKGPKMTIGSTTKPNPNLRGQFQFKKKALPRLKRAPRRSERVL